MIVAGLYSVLWGKYKENKEKKETERMALPLAIKGIEGNGQFLDVIEVDEVQLEKAKANSKISSSMVQGVIKVGAPMLEISSMAEEHPRA